jgi:hypothetical protein
MEKGKKKARNEKETGRAVRARRIRTSTDRTTEIREKNSTITDGDRATK